MGTHPSGPSVLCDISPKLNGKTLGTLLEMWPEFLGTVDLCTKYKRKLPFLFKVLSVRKPLSIQVHPDKTLAAKLHLSKPNLYPDSNHKPEMAIAMSKFYALAYFRSHDEIINFMQEYEQLREVIGQDLCSEYIAADEASKKLCLKKCFSSLMNASTESVSKSLKSLRTLAETRQCLHLSMFLRIVNHYPDDVGAFALFFLNLVELAPYEALYINAREPHCYLHGDCLEIMADSDNVIRAGLTPKFKDVDLLLECLRYEPQKVHEFTIKPTTVDMYTSKYVASAEEFAIERIHIPESHDGWVTYTSEPKSSGSIIIVIEGMEAKCNDDVYLRSGEIYFFPAGLKMKIINTRGCLTLYRAFIRN